MIENGPEQLSLARTNVTRSVLAVLDTLYTPAASNHDWLGAQTRAYQELDQACLALAQVLKAREVRAREDAAQAAAGRYVQVVRVEDRDAGNAGERMG